MTISVQLIRVAKIGVTENCSSLTLCMTVTGLQSPLSMTASELHLHLVTSLSHSHSHSHLKISDQVRATFLYEDSPEAYSYGISVAMYTTAFVCAIGGGAFLLASLFVARDRHRVEQARVPVASTVQHDDSDEDQESLHDPPSYDVRGDDKRLLQ